MRRWWIGLLGVPLLPSTALAAGEHEAFSWFQLLDLPVPQYVLSAILIAVLIAIPGPAATLPLLFNTRSLNSFEPDKIFLFRSLVTVPGP